MTPDTEAIRERAEKASDGDVDVTLSERIRDDGYVLRAGNPIDAEVCESLPCPECDAPGMIYTALERGQRGEPSYSYRAVASCARCRYEMEF